MVIRTDRTVTVFGSPSQATTSSTTPAPMTGPESSLRFTGGRRGARASTRPFRTEMFRTEIFRTEQSDGGRGRDPRSTPSSWRASWSWRLGPGGLMARENIPQAAARTTDAHTTPTHKCTLDRRLIRLWPRLLSAAQIRSCGGGEIGPRVDQTLCRHALEGWRRPDGCHPPPAARQLRWAPGTGSRLRPARKPTERSGMPMWSSIRQRGRAADMLLRAELIQVTPAVREAR